MSRARLVQQLLGPGLPAHQQQCLQGVSAALAQSLASLHATLSAAGGNNAVCTNNSTQVVQPQSSHLHQHQQQQMLVPQQQQPMHHHHHQQQQQAMHHPHHQRHHHQQQQHHWQRAGMQHHRGAWPQPCNHPARCFSSRAAEAETEADSLSDQAPADWRDVLPPHTPAAAKQHHHSLLQQARGRPYEAISSSSSSSSAAGQQQQHQQPPGSGGYDDLARQQPSINVIPVESSDLLAPMHHAGLLQQLSQQQQQQQLPQAAAEPQKIPVNAVHLAGEIDFQSFVSDVNPKHSSIARDHALLEFEEMADDRVLLGAGGSEAVERRIMVVYRFGGVVFFNTRARARERLLEKVLPYVKLPKGGPAAADAAAAGIAPEAGAGPTGGLRTDETTVVVRANLEAWSALEPDKVVVQTLDVANVRVISHVLGQSVALDYYNEKVDAAIQQFNPYLVEVARSGACNNVKEARLLQLIADNSLLYTDVVTKIGLLDISQTAWTQDRYHELWQSLRVDYEIDRRFDAINRKLGPMIENAKFLLDIRAESKSSNAELTIIVLICLEVVVNMVGHVMHWGG